MINVLIVDDEQHVLKNLELLLAKVPDIAIIDKIADPELAISVIMKNNVDLVFLDIKMPGISGFDILDAVIEQGAYDFDVVFLTAYDEYAIKAFKYSAFDYLIKPIDENELNDTLIKYRAKINLNLNKQNLLLKEYLDTDKKIRLKTETGYEFLHVDEVVYIEGNGNYSTFVLTDSRKLLVCKTLKIFESEPGTLAFIRIHKSYLINLQYLRSYSSKTKSCILQAGELYFDLPVSSRMMKNLPA